MDVIGTPERPTRSSRGLPARLRRPSAWLVGPLAATVLLGGAVAAAVVEEPLPPPVVLDADLRPGDGIVVSVVGGSVRRSHGAPQVGSGQVGSGPVGTLPIGAVGRLTVAVANGLDARVRLGAVGLGATGLRVVSVRPAFRRPLAPREVREFDVEYAVPSCALLLLPVRLRVSYLGVDGRARAELLTLGPPGPAFAPCPAGSTRQVRPDLAVRAIGGSSRRVGRGAQGEVALEVRNAGVALRLLRVGAEVPGVRFTDRGQPQGLQLGPDDRVEARLAFDVPDCALLRRTGRLVLAVEQQGVASEVGLTVTTDAEAGTVRQLALDLVLQACAPGT